MIHWRRLLIITGLLCPVISWASCLTNPDVVMLWQTTYTNRKPPLWQIKEKNPYTKENLYNNFAIKYSDNCALIDDKLDVDLALYALAYSSYKSMGEFEQDDNHLRFLVDKLRFSYQMSERVRFDFGKLRLKSGLFYLKSPTNLLNSYYSGFKSTRIYDLLFRQIYMPSFWAAEVIQDADDYTFSFAAVPKLSDMAQYYESSGNWSDIQRSNSVEGYLFNYTDYRFQDNTPSLNVRLGHLTSIALGNSYQIAPQWVINTELAYHTKQQWRHLDDKNTLLLTNYHFPTELYDTKNNDSVELAIGMQYTADNFSQFGLEYYFQSEGYSKAQWNKQINILRFLNNKTAFSQLNQLFDSYKYLMASEIYNASSQGYFLRKHYLNAYAHFQLDDATSLQTYTVLSLTDSSVLVDLSYHRPLQIMDNQLEAYTGIHGAFGRRDSEFGLFGENIDIYLGLKYHF